MDDDKKVTAILKIFNVKYAEIQDLFERLRRIGVTFDISAVFQDLFKLQRVLELYCRTDWSEEDKFVAIAAYLKCGNDDYRLSSLFAIPVEEDAHVKFRNLIRRVDVEQLKIQYRKAKYRDLIRSHVRKADLAKLEMAILGSIAAFNSKEKRVAEIIMEKYVQASTNKAFWNQNCDAVLSEICSEFKSLLSQYYDCEPSDDILFNMFQLLTLYFASMVLQKNKMQRWFSRFRKL